MKISRYTCIWRIGLLVMIVLPLFAACENLWDEHCVYTGYLEGHIELSDSTLKQTYFRLSYYPLSGQGIGALDGQWNEYDKKGKAGRLVNIGDYRVLSYCPGDFEIRDTASFTSLTLVGKHGWDAASGLELITTNSRPAASDWGRGNVDIDDTTKVWMKPELLTQHLRTWSTKKYSYYAYSPYKSTCRIDSIYAPITLQTMAATMKI